MSFGSFRGPNLPGQCLKRPVVVLQIFVALQQDKEFYLHPLLHRRLRASSPICIVGPAVESKAAQAELSGSESRDGWKWPTISLYDSRSTHAYYKWKEVQAVVGFPEKIPVKMPNYLNVDQGAVKSPTTVGLLCLLLKCFGLCPKQPNGENSEVLGDVVCILICTCLRGLPFHCSALLELVSVGVLFTGHKAELKDYIKTAQAMYASGDLYAVKWREWYSSLLSGVPMAVHKPQDEDDDDGDLIPEEEEESTPPKKTTPSKVKREAESESEVEEVGKNKKKKKEGQQQKEAKDDSGKGKPKAGVAPFLGRVRTASKK